VVVPLCDAVGNRISRTDRGTGALAGFDATTTYTHKAPKTGLPHAVQTATVKGGANDGRTSSFAYDAAGNTTKRTIGTTAQTLTWDHEGNLATLTENGTTTSYRYDADGNRLITKDADGTTTLTLPGDNELKIKPDGSKEGIRYYTHGDETVAVRTSSGFSFLVPDQQGTVTAAIAMTTLAVTRRKQLPFGEMRSTQTETIPGTGGFVGGTNDPTGLVHLGAREYAPTVGRFLSVDPVIDLDDPAQMNACSYAHNNSVTKSDPDGLRPDGPAGGACCNDDRWGQDRGMSVGHTLKNGHWVWHQTPLKDKESRKKYAAYRASPSTYKVYHYNAKAAAHAKAQALARAKAKADGERRKKDGIFANLMKGNWGAAWENVKQSGAGRWVGNHWEDIKTYSALVGFGVCVVAFAGTCMAVGVGIATAKFLGDGLGYGNWDVAAYSKDLAWTAVGGGSAAVYGRAVGGARTWRAAYSSNAIARVPRAYRTKVPGVRGVGGGVKSWVTADNPKGAIDWGTTYGNMGVNAAFNTGSADPVTPALAPTAEPADRSTSKGG
jgi:RHS repeat-associated protein